MKKNQNYSTTQTMFSRTCLIFSFTLLLLLSNYTFDASSSTKKAYAAPASSSSYRFLGDAYGRGGIQKVLVGPGQSASQQLYYMTYTYVNGSMDLVTIDPNSGRYQVYPTPVSTEQAAWAMTSGPDNNIYIGTLPNAHLLRFNTQAQKLVDLGAVPADPVTGRTQTYIWQLTTSAYNHNIYGCTYPSADLISYNPLAAQPKIVNLGSMDTSGQEQYGHTCVADTQASAPYIYIGLGSVSNQLAVYNIATHTITNRVNRNTAGFGAVYQGADGFVYGSLQNGSVKESYRLSFGQVTATNSPSYPAPNNLLSDGGYINASGNTTTVSYPNSKQASRSYAYSYPGKKLSIYRLGSGPDGKIYGGTALSYELFTFDPTQASSGVQMLGQVGDGQPYAFLAYEGELYITAYAGTPVSMYRPQIGYSPTNPANVSNTILPTDLRPRAISGTAENELYVGATASYGKITGPLLAWNTQNGGAIQTYYPIANQSIAALTTTSVACLGSSKSYCLLGGSTIYGGTGTVPAAQNAELFTWDTVHQQILHTYALPATSAGQTISSLITNPQNGYVYGVSVGSRGTFLFIFDPASGRFINNGTALPLNSGVVYSSLTIHQGRLWGESSNGFFSVNLSNGGGFALQPSPVQLSAGFAQQGNTLYAASGSGLWSYTMV
jgi:hypothetical protein